MLILFQEERIMSDTSSSIIEGISDSVLVTWLLSSVIVIFFLLWSKFQVRNHLIHPNHQDAVQAIRQQVSHAEQNITGPPTNENDLCPICIDHLHFAVETNCGHIFCCK